MNKDHCGRKIFLAKPIGNRPWDRPLIGWIDRVEKDQNILKIKKCKRLTEVDLPGENFWRRPGPTQSYRAIEEDEDICTLCTTLP
ncbi:hypothetical protein TNCV_1862351 [Trichonephila clavipes]|nr:hypothetical protein TNCV_1862351 [Trichonephila clavipes]